MQIPTSHLMNVSELGRIRANATMYSANSSITVFCRPSLSETAPRGARAAGFTRSPPTPPPPRRDCPVQLGDFQPDRNGLPDDHEARGRAEEVDDPQEPELTRADYFVRGPVGFLCDTGGRSRRGSPGRLCSRGGDTGYHPP